MALVSGIRIAALASGAAALTWVFAQTPSPLKPLEVVRVAESLHVLIDPEDNGNVAVYETSEGVVLVDAKFERHVPQMLEAVAKITDKPVRYLLSTHHHDDHTGGNAALLAKTGARGMGHEEAARLMRDRKMPGAPEVTFATRAAIHLGGKTIEAFYFGRGHTSGDAVYVFSAENAAHVGDLMELVGPYIDHGAGGSGREFPTTVERVLTLGVTTWIPGHGKPMTTETARLYQTDLSTALARAREMYAKGVQKDDAMKEWNGEGLRYCCRTNTWKRSLPGLWDEMARGQ
ncbi:MAG: MBL fold metallo-hydrolase [Acidobacteriota bacterium]